MERSNVGRPRAPRVHARGGNRLEGPSVVQSACDRDTGMHSWSRYRMPLTLVQVARSRGGMTWLVTAHSPVFS